MKKIGPGLPKYPWDRWFRRKRFTLVKNKDYDCMTHSMAIQVRQAAWKREIQVSVRIPKSTRIEVEVL